MATNQGFKSLIPASGRLDGSFLYWWLKVNRAYLESLGRGATFKEISKAVTAEIRLPLPPIEEQRRIAAVLDRADELRAKRRAALALLGTLSESIFLDMFGDAIRDGDVEMVPLDDLIDQNRPICYGILMPGPDLPDGVPYVRVVDLRDGGIAWRSVRRTTSEIDHQYRRSRLKPGDLVMSIRGHVGRLGVVPAELDGANVTQDSARISIQRADPRFVVETIRSVDAQRWMTRNTKGVAVRGLNIRDLRRLPIPTPPLDSQTQFGAIARQIDGQIEVARRGLSQLDALFASLQQRAFRGEL